MQTKKKVDTTPIHELLPESNTEITQESESVLTSAPVTDEVPETPSASIPEPTPVDPTVSTPKITVEPTERSTSTSTTDTPPVQKPYNVSLFEPVDVSLPLEIPTRVNRAKAPRWGGSMLSSTKHTVTNMLSSTKNTVTNWWRTVPHKGLWKTLGLAILVVTGCVLGGSSLAGLMQRRSIARMTTAAQPRAISISAMYTLMSGLQATAVNLHNAAEAARWPKTKDALTKSATEFDTLAADWRWMSPTELTLQLSCLETLCDLRWFATGQRADAEALTSARADVKKIIEGVERLFRT